MARSPRPPKGCRRTRWSIVVVPSLSIHPLLGSAGFHQLRCYYEEIRLLRGHRPVVVASFRSTARADPSRSPWVRTLDVPPLPPPLPPRPRLDFGRRVWRHAHPAGPACTEVHLRSVLRFASGFFSTRPHGASSGVSRRQSLRAVASSSRLLPTRPAKDFHLQSSAHARHTSGRPASPAPRPPEKGTGAFTALSRTAPKRLREEVTAEWGRARDASFPALPTAPAGSLPTAGAGRSQPRMSRIRTQRRQ